MRVAVVIPTRDRGALLEAAVTSAIAAESVDEVVIVDAGSTDGSVEKARRLGDVQVVELGAANAARARNAGAAATRADALAFLDSDDVMLPGKPTALGDALDSDAGLALVHGLTTVIDAEGAEDPVATIEHERQRAEATRVGTSYEALAGYCAMYTSATLLRRSAFEAAGGYDESIDVFEDWDLYLRLALIGRLDYVPEPAALYRVWPGNVGWERTAAGIVRVAEKHLASPPPLSAAALAEARYGFLRRLSAANHVLVRPAATRRAALAALRAAPRRALGDADIRRPLMRSFIPRRVLQRRRPAGR